MLIEYVSPAAIAGANVTALKRAITPLFFFDILLALIRGFADNLFALFKPLSRFGKISPI
tara:strand:+ start:227 stop:406 length:180 start_codon:yes stop_codon:yes gene_type:complete